MPPAFALPPLPFLPPRPSPHLSPRPPPRLSPLPRPRPPTACAPPPTWDGSSVDPSALLSRVKFDTAGLVPAVAQHHSTGQVLMLAYMSAASIAETLRTGRAVYYSRSRAALWRKGDSSGQTQHLVDILLDCDGDTILLKVHQIGVACHTGRRTCFYTSFRPPGHGVQVADVEIDPKVLYG